MFDPDAKQFTRELDPVIPKGGAAGWRLACQGAQVWQDRPAIARIDRRQVHDG